MLQYPVETKPPSGARAPGSMSVAGWPGWSMWGATLATINMLKTR